MLLFSPSWGVLIYGAYLKLNPCPTGERSALVAQAVVCEWLEELTSGGDAKRYWHPAADSVGFYAARAYKIVKASSDRVIVRVDSSNRFGTAITMDWLVIVSTTDSAKKPGDAHKLLHVELYSGSMKPRSKRFRTETPKTLSILERLALHPA